MEDMARLALVEQSVRNDDKFCDMLYEVLRHINIILENPHDYELRTIKNDVLKKCLEYEALVDYMKYVGFQPVDDTWTYPREISLSKLRIAQATIERKLCFCSGKVDQTRVTIKTFQNTPAKKPLFQPADILKTNNALLLKVQSIFNNMIRYEDEELLELARAHLPIVTLQLRAIDRVREHQRRIKTGEISGLDMPFDIAQLMELLGWFKYEFFSWVDRPECGRCCGKTVYTGASSLKTETEVCVVEIFKCTNCKTLVEFPRFNDPRALLRYRRGRCGEWANCFTLFCRSLGYETRYVYDLADHVWCEVFDYDTNMWLHVDPCEGKLNAPLMYSHGWGKILSYVVAVSRDDIQDVTWRYTNNHKEVLARRKLCSEIEFIEMLQSLRTHRQLQVSEARRRYLAKRTLQELVQLMVERQPSEYESQGRISGSIHWRRTRGEIGINSHTFNFTRAGFYQIRYLCNKDKYRVSCDDTEINVIQKWSNGTYESRCMIRNIELDWKKVYLARHQDATEGIISWRLATTDELVFKKIRVSMTWAVYESGSIVWMMKFDDEPPIQTQFGEEPKDFEREFTTVIITAILSGGNGDVAWQHAQVCRTCLDSRNSALKISSTVAKK